MRPESKPLTRRSRDAKKRQLALLRSDAPFLVPAQPAIDHVRMLRAKYKLSHHSIAAISGVSYATICALEYENHPDYRTDVWEHTAKAVLAVGFTPRLLPATAVVSPIGAARRLRALMAIGYTGRDIAARLGMCPRNLLAITAQISVSAGVWTRLADLYDALHMTPGPSLRGRALGVRKGWAPPMAWEEDEIDDPDARPSGIGGDARRNDQALELQRAGLDVSEIAGRLRIKEGSVERAIKRALEREEGAA